MKFRTGRNLRKEMSAQLAEAEFSRQLEEAVHLRELAYSIAEGKHDGKFERKDYIGFALFNRCLQTHEATELVVRKSLIDDAWVLVRAMVEHAVNSVYMFYVADAATADSFNDYQDYLAHKTLLDLKSTDEVTLRSMVSAEEEEKGRLRFEAVRGRFDDKRGDRWCVDDALYKRAAQVDRAVSASTGKSQSDLLWLVNSLWRYASTYTHGMAGALTEQVREEGEAVIIHRKYSYAEAAKVVFSANSALYHVLLPVDIRLGGKHVAELNHRFNLWLSAK